MPNPAVIEQRATSTAILKHARDIWHEPCQSLGTADLCQKTLLRSVSKSSSKSKNGEVSKSSSDEKRGGARNRADRTSIELSVGQVGNLIEATGHAIAIGLPFTRFITIHWELAGIDTGRMAKATGKYLDLLTKSLRRHGSETSWLWVHEDGHGKGGHCHILVHVPADLVRIINRPRFKWLRLISGRPYRANVIHSVPIGRRLRLELTNPELYFSNVDAALGYVLKGAGPEAARRYALERLIPGGLIVGKRCGTSQNIGPKARANASMI